MSRALITGALRPAQKLWCGRDPYLLPTRSKIRIRAWRDGELLPLSPKEFAVLEVLMRAERRVVSAEELLEKAWDENADPFTNAVRVAMLALRKKLGDPPVTKTVPGVGYRLDG